MRVATDLQICPAADNLGVHFGCMQDTGNANVKHSLQEKVKKKKPNNPVNLENFMTGKTTVLYTVFSMCHGKWYSTRPFASLNAVQIDGILLVLATLRKQAVDKHDL